MKKSEKKVSAVILLFCMAVLLIIAAAAGVLYGSVELSMKEVMDCITGADKTSTAYILIKNVRLPRVLGGIVVGAALSCAGVILQTVMNNVLASPNTIGVNSGAGFGVMISMIVFPYSISVHSFAAFAGALLTSIIVYAVAIAADSSRTTIILAGITISSFLSAGINTVKLLNTDITINITSFMIGSFNGLTSKKIWIPGIVIGITLVLTMLMAKQLNALSLGDEIARSIGLNVNLNRFILLVLSSILAGCAVSIAGLISFVGLIVPHICRQLFGSDARLLLPCSALLGSIFCVVSDLVGRVLFAPYELPVGLIMSFVGGPFFLYILMRKMGRRRVNA